MDQGTFHPTEAGTPQGGVISPLLANIALHGMEAALGVQHRRGQVVGPRALVRYADDFCVFCESREDAEAAQDCLEGWFKTRGLEFSSEKTRIVHLTEGIDFLGFHIQLYPVSTTRTGWKLLTTPSKKSIQKHRDQMKEEWQAVRGWSIQKILWKFNPIIRGWANYFRTGTAKATFRSLENWTYFKEVRHVKRTHPKKTKAWRQGQYWGRWNLDRHDHWVFGDKHSGQHLFKYTWFPIERHILVKGTASPDDPSLKAYWEQRARTKANDLPPSRQKLARRQNGLCPMCRNTLFNEEELHVHHAIPRKRDGNSTYSNLQLVHLFCHQQAHAKEPGNNE